jgi:hypothetical protein
MVPTGDGGNRTRTEGSEHEVSSRIPKSKVSDYDLIEARYTISTLQTALDRATAQVRELQATIGALNERVAVGNEQVENLALDLSMERLRGKIAAEWDDARATVLAE